MMVAAAERGRARSAGAGTSRAGAGAKRRGRAKQSGGGREAPGPGQAERGRARSAGAGTSRAGAGAKRRGRNKQSGAGAKRGGTALLSPLLAGLATDHLGPRTVFGLTEAACLTMLAATVAVAWRPEHPGQGAPDPLTTFRSRIAAARRHGPGSGERR